MTENTSTEGVEIETTEVDEVVETTPGTAVTGFKAAQIINLMFKQEGIKRELKPQMVYGYISKGVIPTVEGPLRNGKPQKLIELTALAAFYKDLKSNRVATASKSSTEDLLGELKSLVQE